MPGYDRSGPMGAGSRTGGGFGYCGAGAGVGRPGENTGGFGFRRGRAGRQNMAPRGRGGRCFRDWTPPGFGPWARALAPNDEAGMLLAQADRIREELASIEARIEQLQQSQEKK